MKRSVIQARLLGLDKNATKRGRENEYAIDVVLSDESQYTMFRTLKEIVGFHTKMMNTFKVEAGYFKKEERVIPECPIKQTIFGPQRAIRDDKSFGRLLNFYIKDIPALPAAVVKSELVTEFFSLRASDLDAPGEESKSDQRKKKRNKIELTADSLITGPLALKSYTTVAEFVDKKTKFSFKEGTIVQVIQKDPGGWWMVDAQGLIGWAPASYLMPVNDLKEEEEENETLIEQERVGTRYISISAYQASREDELSFVRGAVVKLLKKYVDGWWSVRYNGGEGFVPGAMFRKFDKRQATIYVKKIKRNFSSRGTTRIVPTVKPQWMNSRYDAHKPAQKNVMSALAQVQDTLRIPKPKPAESPSPVQRSPMGERQGPAQTPSPEAMSSKTKKDSDDAPQSTKYVAKQQYMDTGVCIQEDDEVAVMDSSDHDWWYVADSKGAEGWAPASYFQPNHTNTTPTHNLNNYINENELAVEDEDFDDLDDDAIDNLDIEDCYVVLKDYAKQDVDELDLFEGQVVCVIDDTDKDVWYVNADGQEGWVPSDILQLITDEDTESSRESTPMDTLSNEASAENSEMSDDGLEHDGNARFKRRHHIRNKISNYETDETLAPYVRSRSVVVNSRSPSPSRGALTHSPRIARSPPQLNRLHLSDGSDSDPNGRQMEDVTVLIGDKTIEEIERELEEADRIATQAKLKAQALKERLELARQTSLQ